MVSRRCCLTLRIIQRALLLFVFVWVAFLVGWGGSDVGLGGSDNLAWASCFLGLLAFLMKSACLYAHLGAERGDLGSSIISS